MPSSRSIAQDGEKPRSRGIRLRDPGASPAADPGDHGPSRSKIGRKGLRGAQLSVGPGGAASSSGVPYLRAVKVTATEIAEPTTTALVGDPLEV